MSGDREPLSDSHESGWNVEWHERGGNSGERMKDYDKVRLRPVEERDLDVLERIDSDPAMSEPFEWRGFRSPRGRRKRWEQDGHLGSDDSTLIVAMPDGSFAGVVDWRPLSTSGPVVCVQIGILLLPEHRGMGLGTTAQRLLADYLFSTTTLNRIEATTEVDNVAEQTALEHAGFTREGVLRGRASSVVS
jgi:ribosomal-protein-alanine N-acetyltransferase